MVHDVYVDKMDCLAGICCRDWIVGQINHLLSIFSEYWSALNSLLPVDESSFSAVFEQLKSFGLPLPKEHGPESFVVMGGSLHG